MSNNRLNNIDYQINSNNVNKLSNEDLFYYLYIHTNNDKIQNYNESSIKKYLEKINYSFFYENIFVNNSNYTTVAMSIIGLLIPFYYNYPTFYKLGTFGFLIGISSFISIFLFLKKSYSSFFPQVTKHFLVLNIVLYLVFFVLLNKLNHLSLFFICSVLSFLIINYIYRVKLSLPTNNNQFNKLSAKLKPNTKFTEFNVPIEKVCTEIVSRFNLKLPSSQMLYTYIAEFEIGDNSKSNIMTNFITNVSSPFIVILYLTLLGIFLNKINSGNEIIGNVVKLFPLIGLDQNSFKYYTCQANYVLPIQFNYNLFLHEFYQEKELDDKVYAELVKAMSRINNEFIKKYNPCFTKLEDLNNEEVYEQLKSNHILNQIKTFLKKNNIIFNANTYITEIFKLVFDDTVTYDKKEEAYRLIENINNTLKIEVDVDKSYEDDVKLARNELLYNKNIDDKYKPILQKLIDKYVTYFDANLKENKLYGYDYNILTFNIFTRKVRLFFNKVFQQILKYLSLWLIFGKPITSGWLLTSYLFLKDIDIQKFISYFNSDNALWKYTTMGFDYKYMKDQIKNFGNHNNNNNNDTLSKDFNYILRTIGKILVYILIAFPFLNWYNNSFFGLTLSPIYYNLLSQGVFIINIIGNIYFIKKYYENKENNINPLGYNVMYFLLLLVIIIIYYIIKTFLIK